MRSTKRRDYVHYYVQTLPLQNRVNRQNPLQNRISELRQGKANGRMTNRRRKGKTSPTTRTDKTGDIKSTTDSPGLSGVSKESPRHPHHSVTPDTSTMKKPPPNVQPEQKAQASQVSPQTRDQNLESNSEPDVLVIPKLLHQKI